MTPARDLLNIALDCIDTCGGDNTAARGMAREWIADTLGADHLDTKVEIAFELAAAGIR